MQNVVPVVILGGAVAAGAAAHQYGWFRGGDDKPCTGTQVKDDDGNCCNADQKMSTPNKCCANLATADKCCNEGETIVAEKCCAEKLDDTTCKPPCNRYNIDGDCCDSGKVDSKGKCATEQFSSGLNACLLRMPFLEFSEEKSKSPWEIMSPEYKSEYEKMKTAEANNTEKTKKLKVAETLVSFEKKHCASYDASVKEKAGLSKTSLCYPPEGKLDVPDSSLKSSLFVEAPEKMCALAAVPKCGIRVENVDRIEADISWTGCKNASVNFLSLVNRDPEHNGVLEMLGICPTGGKLRHGYYRQNDIETDGTGVMAEQGKQWNTNLSGDTMDSIDEGKKHVSTRFFIPSKKTTNGSEVNYAKMSVCNDGHTSCTSKTKGVKELRTPGYAMAEENETSDHVMVNPKGIYTLTSNLWGRNACTPADPTADAAAAAKEAAAVKVAEAKAARDAAQALADETEKATALEAAKVATEEAAKAMKDAEAKVAAMADLAASCKYSVKNLKIVPVEGKTREDVFEDSSACTAFKVE